MIGKSSTQVAGLPRILTLSLDMMKYNPDQEKEIQILNNPKLKKHNKHSRMVELNKSNFTEGFHLDLHGSPIKLERLAIGHIKLI